MNLFDLSASELMIWGLVLHLVADRLLQNEWMALNKMKRRPSKPPRPWWDRHPASYVHAGIHGVFLAVIFGWVAVPLAIAHFFIDLRFPVTWWSKLITQTQPSGKGFDIGADVRMEMFEMW